MHYALCSRTPCLQRYGEDRHIRRDSALSHGVMRRQEKDQFGLVASLDTRLKAADALMNRYNAADKGNGQTQQKLDALLEEPRRAVCG